MPKPTHAKPKRTREQLVKLPGDALLTSAEVATLRKAYKSTPASKIAKMLKRTKASVQTKVRLLGLKKAAKKKVAKKAKKAKKTTKKAAAK